MKLNTILLLLSGLTLFSFTGQNTPHTNSSIIKCDDVPALNAAVIDYVKTTINKKVGRGECWDLAAEALNTTGAKWDGNFGFGREVDPAKECVYPGDIMQFTNVTVTYEKDKTMYMEKMQKHTAVIYEVKSADDFTLADQNTGTSGRKVGLHPLQLKNITTGKFKIYRPQK